MNTVKTKVLVSAILSIVLCVSLIAGATFALFTSESNVNIAVTSGKVDVVASVDETSVQTKQLDKDYVDGIENTYGGGIVIADGNITIPNIVPGDGIKFSIKVENNSTIAIKYRTVLTCTDAGLLNGLNIQINGQNYSGTFTGSSKVSAWTELAVGKTLDTIEVTIELEDRKDNNQYQGKSVEISYKVEAVQGNAEKEVIDPNAVYYIFTPQDLVDLRKADFAKIERIELMNDIDMTGVEYTPWNMVIASGKTVKFEGDGNVIRNLVVEGNGTTGVGFDNAALFASVNANPHNGTQKFVITNLAIDNANVTNNDGAIATAAALIGAAQCVSVEISNCTVTNSAITSDAYAAALIGYEGQHLDSVTTVIDNCVVDNCEISGNDATAGLVALSNKTLTVSDVTVQNSVIDGGKGYSAGALVGTWFFTEDLVATATLENNTFAMSEGNYVGYDKEIGYFHSSGLYVVNSVPYTTTFAQFDTSVDDGYAKVVLAASMENETVPHTGGTNAYDPYIVADTFTLAAGTNLTVDFNGYILKTPVRLFKVNGGATLNLINSDTSGEQSGIYFNKTDGDPNVAKNAYGIETVHNGGKGGKYGTLNIGKNVTLGMGIENASAQPAGMIYNCGATTLDGGELIAAATCAVYIFSSPDGHFTMKNGAKITLYDANATGIYTFINSNAQVNVEAGCSITGPGTSYNILSFSSTYKYNIAEGVINTDKGPQE